MGSRLRNGGTIVAAGRTDIGRKRSHNEDFVLLDGEQQLYLVLDGVGGREAGDLASRTAARSMADFFANSNDEGGWPDEYRTLFDLTLPPPARRLCAATRKANHDVHALAATQISQPKNRKMSSTVVAAYLPASEQRMHLVHVGDSRGYRLRAGELTCLTRDHTLRNAAKLRDPDISEERLSSLPANMITRALGVRDTVELSVQSLDVEQGDRFLLCSDGLNAMLSDRQIAEALLLCDDPNEACELLIELANEAGGRDNISAVLIDIHGGQR